eukprot:184622-Pelagomonas_calceolata.AAC.1
MGTSQEIWDCLGDVVGLQVMGMGLKFSNFQLGLTQGNPVVDVIQASKCAYGGGNTAEYPSEHGALHGHI